MDRFALDKLKNVMDDACVDLNAVDALHIILD